MTKKTPPLNPAFQKAKNKNRCPHCEMVCDKLMSSPTHDWVCSACYTDSIITGNKIEIDERKAT
jgi:hypothetical protein